jgi:hypothetical protein
MSGFIAGSVISGGASFLGAREQAKSTDRATEEGRRQFERQVELQAPFREGGIQALNKLIPMAMNYKPFSLKDFEADPGYGFRLREGMKALERSAAARGGLLSGATLRGVQEYGQDLASQEYINAFNRYQTNRSAEMNPLLSLAGAAQTSSNTLSDAAGRLGEQIGSNLIQGGVARASGYAGIANAANTGLSNYLAYQQNQARNRLDQQYIDTLRSRANTYSDVV